MSCSEPPGSGNTIVLLDDSDSTAAPPAAAAATFSESVNFAHALAGTLSVKPSRSVVSRTRITPTPLAVSTQELPDVPE